MFGSAGDDMFTWQATMQHSPYSGELVLLKYRFPFSRQKIDHRNRATPYGWILLKMWSLVLTISKVLLSTSSLLTDPNPPHPLVPGIAQALFARQVEARQLSPRMRAEIRHVSVWSVICVQCIAAVWHVATRHASRLPTISQTASWLPPEHHLVLPGGTTMFQENDVAAIV